MNTYKLVYDSVFDTDFIKHIFPSQARQKPDLFLLVFIGYLYGGEK
jgi:hypothetical protein